MSLCVLWVLCDISARIARRRVNVVMKDGRVSVVASMVFRIAVKMALGKRGRRESSVGRTRGKGKLIPTKLTKVFSLKISH